MSKHARSLAEFRRIKKLLIWLGNCTPAAANMILSNLQTRMLGWLLILGSVSSIWASDRPADYVLQLKHEFIPGEGLPDNPSGRLLEVNDGEFIGVSSFGGYDDNGTVFTINTEGEVSVIHSFDGTNGSHPIGGIISDGQGSFFGLTSEGGSADQGTIYRITLEGEFESLFSFSETNGSEPRGLLEFADDGAMYGCTTFGGAYHKGAIFRITTNGTFAVIHSFDGTNGVSPLAGLIKLADGRLYGTTGGSGTNANYYFDGPGVVFRISTSGMFALLDTFDGTNGNTPGGPLCVGADGKIYGTTLAGGVDHYGNVFRLTSVDAIESIYEFDGLNGGTPSAGLIVGRDGQLYGTTSYTIDFLVPFLITNGTLFRVSTKGAHEQLARFDGTNGMMPFNELTLGRDKNLYASLGDVNWQLSPSGNAGTFIKLLTLPTITSISKTNDEFEIEWNSIPGTFYEIYHHYALDSPHDWVGMRSLTATGFVSTLTVPAANEPVGYYKVLLFDF